MGVINTPGAWSLKHKRQVVSSPRALPLWKRSAASRLRMYNNNLDFWRGKPLASHLKRLQFHADTYGWEFDPPATALDATEAYVEIMCGERDRPYTFIR